VIDAGQSGSPDPIDCREPVRRNYVGNYCTSLDMAGTSITLSRLAPEIEGLLAAPAEIAIRTF
jgi:phosphoenolpyruvate---glycerone phosphotransferase subunit DhaK